jgi:predicted restriction endonuclease
LLDAAHIVMDADEQLGQPIVSNGLPLTKIHHAAFDVHLIGIDPDTEFTSLTGCLKSMMAISSNAALRASAGN